VTRAARLAVALAMGCAALMAACRGGLVLAQEPLFRAVTDLVTVDAYAHRAGVPIAGLTRADFELRDNGVLQTIESIGTTDSAHVIIGIDLSGSVDGTTLDGLRTAVRAVLTQLTSDDRISVFTFADRLRVLSRAAVPSPEVSRAIDAMTAVGSTPLHDALVLGTALARADSRPPVLLLFTDGNDTASWSTVGRALAALRHGNLVVYPVGAGLASALASSPSSDYFRHSTWLAPLPGETLRLLQEIADRTGGEFLQVRRDDRLATTFSTILARYRQRYLLSFSPTGVKTGDGWHRIEVKLRTQPGTIVAREGYMARP
jgi:VWFA-related protein